MFMTRMQLLTCLLNEVVCLALSELAISEATCFSNAKVACCCDALASCVVVGTLANKIVQNLPFPTSRKEYSVRFSWLVHMNTALLLIACKN